MTLQNSKNRIPDRKKLIFNYEKSRPHYEDQLSKHVRRIRNLINRTGLNTTVKYRVKTFDSYFEKLLKLNTSSKRKVLIKDLLGIRIICPFLEEINMVERLISEHFKVLEIERKGLKHSFREFGYDSIHLLIKLDDSQQRNVMPHCRNVCEIQLRSILQEAWAEVEHDLIYKANVSLFNEPVKRKLASLNAILTLSDVIFQEIRDYQKQVQQEGLILRQTVQDKVISQDEISILNQLNQPALKEQELEVDLPLPPENTIEKLLLEALNAHSNNHFEKAINIYSRILRMRTNSLTRSIIYNHRGMAYFVQSEYQKSLGDFSRAFENDENNFRALNNRGSTYRILGNYSRAIDDLNRSIEINSLQTDGYYIRALVLNDMEDNIRAIKDCDAILNISPNFLPARQLRKFLSTKLFI